MTMEQFKILVALGMGFGMGFVFCLLLWAVRNGCRRDRAVRVVDAARRRFLSEMASRN